MRIPNTTNNGTRMTVIQGPPGTGKTNVSTLIMRFYLRHHVQVMFKAGSNKAVDVTAARLLKQLRERGEFTDGIYRIKIDALERITVDPEMRERHDDDDWTEGGERTTIQTEGTPRSPSPTSHNPTDRTIQASLEQYLEKQLAGSPADAFSLPRHMYGGNRVPVNNWLKKILLMHEALKYGGEILDEAGVQAFLVN